MTRLIQLNHSSLGRRVAIADDQKLQLLDTASIYQLAQIALNNGIDLATAVMEEASNETLEYDPIYRGESDWKILPAFDHQEEPTRCLVTGTGLTHRKSAENRQAMHAQTELSDSMKMYQWGVEGGRPEPGAIGVQPEWFYKGCGTILRAHGEPLEVPSFANDGGDEAEVAGVYVIDSAGNPRRIGFVQANEFSDHVMEEKNYLYLAHSKLRTCSIGPELIVGGNFDDARGKISIERGGKVFWSQPFQTGEQKMSHTIANLEHHHFKYAAHRRAGDAHIHFFGADVFSFGEKIKLEDGDVMEIELAGFGRALRNPLKADQTNPKLISVTLL
jgi:hypothetical protein